MVGDNLADDIEGAIASGLRAVLVDRSDRYPEYAGERVRGLAELPPLLGLATRRGRAVRAARRTRVAPRAVRAGRRASSRRS